MVKDFQSKVHLISFESLSPDRQRRTTSIKGGRSKKVSGSVLQRKHPKTWETGSVAERGSTFRNAFRNSGHRLRMCGVSRSIEAVSRRHILSCCLWEGQNALIEYRFAEGQYDRLPDLVRELLQLNVDVIVASPTPAVLVAKDAARDTPKRLELKATVGGS